MPCCHILLKNLEMPAVTMFLVGMPMKLLKTPGLVHSKPTGITFTSGATEAANLALFGFCEGDRSRGNHIITCKTEHKAILDSLKALESKDFEVSYLDVDSEGNINLKELKHANTSKTILVCLMLANNETGLIHPMSEIEKIVHSKKVKLMSDIPQTVCKISVNLKEMNLDLAIFSSPKIYGPKGIGAFYINKKTRWKLILMFLVAVRKKDCAPAQ